MRKYWNRKQANEVRPRHIYLLVFDVLGYHINDSALDLRRYYYEHYHERCAVTRERIQWAKAHEQVPVLYRLDTVVGDRTDTFPLKVAWARYFYMHGMDCYVDVLDWHIDQWEHEETHQNIKDIPYEEILNPQRGYYPHYLEELYLAEVSNRDEKEYEDERKDMEDYRRSREGE